MLHCNSQERKSKHSLTLRFREGETSWLQLLMALPPLPSPTSRRPRTARAFSPSSSRRSQNRNCPPFRVNIFAHMLGADAEDPGILKKKAVFFLGFVKYSDIFGNVYTQGFCFLFDNVSGDPTSFRQRHCSCGALPSFGASRAISSIFWDKTCADHNSR